MLSLSLISDMSALTGVLWSASSPGSLDGVDRSRVENQIHFTPIGTSRGFHLAPPHADILYDSPA